MVIIPNVLVISVKAAIFISFVVTALFFLVPLIYGMVHRDEDTVRAGIVGLIIPAFGIICAFLAFYCSLAVQLVIIWAAFALFRTVLPLICGVVNDDPDLKQRGINRTNSEKKTRKPTIKRAIVRKRSRCSGWNF